MRLKHFEAMLLNVLKPEQEIRAAIFKKSFIDEVSALQIQNLYGQGSIAADAKRAMYLLP